MNMLLCLVSVCCLVPVCVSVEFEGRRGNCAHFYSTGMCGTCFQCDSFFYPAGGTCGMCYHCNECKHGGTFDSNCTCHDGCPLSRYGEYCQYRCPNHCRVCDQSSGECYDRCNKNCVDQACNTTTGHCLKGCAVKTLFGDFCNTRCNPNCKQGDCDSTGRCLHGCVEEHFGESCQHKCPSYCRSCDRQNGQTCIVCSNPNYYGEFCDKVCFGCLQPANEDVYCNQQDGSCLFG